MSKKNRYASTKFDFGQNTQFLGLNFENHVIQNNNRRSTFWQKLKTLASQLPIIEQGDLFLCMWNPCANITIYPLGYSFQERGQLLFSFVFQRRTIRVTSYMLSCCTHRIFFCIMCVVGTKALYYNNCLLLCRLLESWWNTDKKMFCATPLFSDENSTFINHHQTM